MATDKMRERFKEIEALARSAGLRPYDIHFFEVPTSVIYEVASYGLPTRYSHWSFGRVYQYQKAQGEMGHSKIYELILNNNPSYAFLDINNTETINLMIAAHCFSHSDFFANNIMFRQADEQNMIQVARRHASFIEQCRKDYGDDEVDEWLDIALALERHIDVHKKFKRTRYPKRQIEYQDRAIGEWEDLIPEVEPLVKKTVKGNFLPPYPEKDLLWFLSEYANIEDWQKRIFEIVRRESYYFYPQYRTKIINEGWASYWHAELMHQYFLGNDNEFGCQGINHPLTSEEHLDFLASHEKVVQPGFKMPLKVEQDEIDPVSGRPTGRRIKTWNPRIVKNPQLFNHATRINPYYVGFRMFRDIKDRWDKYYEEGFMEDEWGEKIPVTIDGAKKIREVMESEDDVSFFRNYLTEELCEDLSLFAYGSPKGYKDDFGVQEEVQKRYRENSDHHMGKLPIDEQLVINGTVQVRTKEVTDVVKAIARVRNNYGAPCIVIRRVDSDGTLRLEHVKEDLTNVDIRYGEQTLQYIFRVWGRPVELIRKSQDVTWMMKYDASGFQVDHATEDYPESIEDKDSGSSW